MCHFQILFFVFFTNVANFEVFRTYATQFGSAQSKSTSVHMILYCFHMVLYGLHMISYVFHMGECSNYWSSAKLFSIFSISSRRARFPSRRAVFASGLAMLAGGYNTNLPQIDDAFSCLFVSRRNWCPSRRAGFSEAMITYEFVNCHVIVNSYS